MTQAEKNAYYNSQRSSSAVGKAMKAASSSIRDGIRSVNTGNEKLGHFVSASSKQKSAKGFAASALTQTSNGKAHKR